MKKLKKIFATLLVVASALSLVACGSTSGDASGSEQSSAEAPAEKIVLQVAYENNPGEPMDEGCKEWKRVVEERSNGTMELQLFPSSQLGSKSDLLDQIVMGEPIITITDGSFLAEYGAPEMSIVSAPYMFTEWQQIWDLMETEWWAEQEDLLAENGIHICTGNWAYGERNVMSTRPVEKIEDMKGLILRTPNTPSYMKAFEAMGAAPTAMALGDVYTATQQGTIDGMENPFTTLYGAVYYEVAKYVTMTQHVKMPIQMICSQAVWESLTEEQQQILTDGGNMGGDVCSEMVLNGTKDVMKKMEEEGVTIIDLSDEERAKFAEAASVIYEDPTITGQWRDGLYDYIQGLIG